jgi:hypothetical protein
MDKENVVYVANGVLFSHNEKRNYVIWRKRDGARDRQVKQNKPASKRYIFSHMWNLDLKKKT